MPPASRQTDAPASNVLELTVGELSGELKRTIEDRFGFVRVRGEISNYRGPHSSGHAYFCLKDEAARIDAVIWKSSFLRLKTKPQEGLEVIATGRVTTFPGKSTYQLIIESIEPAGIGALMAILEARRKALAAEGLFDEARKKALPFLPRVIGVVTSPTGAVIRDILHRLEDRFLRRVLVWPVRVQGETAAAEVAAAIDGFNALPADGPVPRPDVLIVARGGGSLEDLWAFNEEIVVRAAAASTIPLIAAVGHETDWTLIDHAADLRAPTPSGAAEKAVPVRSELLAQEADLARRLTAAALRFVGQRRTEVRALARALPGPDRLLDMPRQRLDALDLRQRGALAAAADRRRLALAGLGNRLAQQAPRTRLAKQVHALNALDQRLRFCLTRSRERRSADLDRAGERLVGVRQILMRDILHRADRLGRAEAALTRNFDLAAERRKERLARAIRLLESLGYRQVLARGFALVRDANGKPLRRAGDVAAAATLDIEFADGHIGVTAGGARVTKSAPRPKPTQGSLF